jgi:uncharacterized membrane protein YhaH (DUF805 family)
MKWYLLMLTRFNDFSGRSRRKEYWMAFLINIIISFVVGFIDGAIGSNLWGGIGVLSALYIIALLIPGIAVTVRRLHDTGRSGWLLLIAVIPIIGAIVLLVWLAADGNRGDNQYGPDPKMAGEPA